MGTSVSQGSPTTVPWRMVKAGYGSSDIEPGNIAKLLFRASSTDANSDLGMMLSEPIIGQCLLIASRADSASSAVREANRQIAITSSNGLAVEIAKRAIVQSFYSNQREVGFAEALFAEATNYLVSRDVSTLIGATDRMKTVSDAIALKDEIGARVQEVVRNRGIPPSGDDTMNWRAYIYSIVGELRQ